MKKTICFIILCVASATQCVFSKPYSEPGAHREYIDINEDWKFKKADEANGQSPGCDDSAWEAVNIPHCYNNYDGQDGGNDYYQGATWYRKSLSVDSRYASKKVFIQFDGAFRVTDVYVNGTHVGQHRGGFAKFRFDITEYLDFSENNLIAVKVNNARFQDVPPLSGDHTHFGGIYREVSLLILDNLQITPMDYASDGVYLSQSEVGSDSAKLDVVVKTSNLDSARAAATVKVFLADAENNIVAEVISHETIPPESTHAFKLSTVIQNPHLWNGVLDPYLYQVYVELYRDGSLVDIVKEPLGFRFYHVDAERGFFLNGKHYDLHGVNKHQDRVNKGYAISDEDIIEDMSLVKEIGSKMLRLSHYQHHELVLKLCDEYGIVVWEEIPANWGLKKDQAFMANAKQQLVEMIRQHYNHPSVIFWGVQNESGNDESKYDVLRQLNELAKSEDPYRLTTQAQHGNVKNENKNNWATDTMAWNKYYGWYSAAPVDFKTWADQVHADYPDKKIGIAEYGAGASIFQHGEAIKKPAPGGDWHPEEWQSYFHEEHWKYMKERDFIWCKLVWNLIDFGSDARNEGDRRGINDKGLVTYDRKVKKDAFFFYKAAWSREPVVHITSRRAGNRKNTKATVKAYANRGSVELFINDEPKGAGTQRDEFIFEWTGLTIEDGARVKAVGSNGKEDLIVWNVPEFPDGVIPPPSKILKPEAGQIEITGHEVGSKESSSTGKKSYDDDKSTRWASDGELKNAWVEYAFEETTIDKVKIMFYNNMSRTYPIRISVDGRNVFEGDTSIIGGFWEHDFTAMKANSLRIQLLGPNSDNNSYLSIHELRILSADR